MKKEIRALKKTEGKHYKEFKRLLTFSKTPKGNPTKVPAEKFAEKVLNPLSMKIKILEAELNSEMYGSPPPQPDDSNVGEKGGRYYLRVSKNGNYYRQYF